MTSDFAAAHLHLERASHYLSGEDETSRTARAAVDHLIDAIVAVQYKRPMGDVVEFPGPAKPGQSASGTG
ncbi:hypothetical protein NKJ35_22585 [Mesorhizobium sp. M0136]